MEHENEIRALIDSAMETLRKVKELLNKRSDLFGGEVKETKDDIINPILAFNDLWLEYPKKLGRAEAQRHFRNTVKTKEDLGRIKKALNNYKTDIQAKGTPETYICHGSTWFNRWQDWVNYEPPKTRVDDGFKPLVL